nr:VOC family protein [Enterococcus sp. BWB1-3]
MKTIAFKISDNHEMVNFYKNIVGFVLKSEENGLSYFGTAKLKNQQLVLEETEIKVKHPNVHFSVGLPSEEELKKAVKRFTDHDYPFEKKEKGIVFTDPEENKVELFIRENLLVTAEVEPESVVPIKKAVDEDDLEVLPIDYSNKLTETCKVIQFCVNTWNKEESKIFYEKILGLEALGENQFGLSNGNLVLFLCEQEVNGSVTDLGWSFISINVKSSEEIEKLKKHLEKEEKVFFVDNKHTILSIFDTNGIEWWFTVK